MLGKLLSAKAAAVAATMAVGGGVAAAATGSFPSPVQSAISSAASHVGIPIPDPDASSATSTTEASTSTTTSISLPAGFASGKNLFGLCTAYLDPNRNASSSGAATGTTGDARTTTTLAATTTTSTLPGSGGATTTAASGGSGPGNATAFQELAAEARAKGESVTQYCTDVEHPGYGDSNRGSGHVPSNDGSPTDSEGGPPSSLPNDRSSDFGSSSDSHGEHTPSTTYEPAFNHPGGGMPSHAGSPNDARGGEHSH